MRRAEQLSLLELQEDVALLKQQMAENTAITIQVRDILASFRVIGVIAKWTAAIGAAVTAIYHGFDFLRGKM